MPPALFRPARHHGPKPMVQIDLGPLSLGGLAQATRRQNDEREHQPDHRLEIRSIQGSESRTQRGQDIAGETRTVPGRRILFSPAMLTVLDDRLEALLHGRYDAGRLATGVLALPHTTTALRRELPGLRERHIGVAAENEIATATVNGEAHHKGFRGRPHAEMEISAVAVATRPGLTAHPIGETEEPADALDACPHAGDTGRDMGHWTPSTRRRGGPMQRALTNCDQPVKIASRRRDTGPPGSAVRPQPF